MAIAAVVVCLRGWQQRRRKKQSQELLLTMTRCLSPPYTQQPDCLNSPAVTIQQSVIYLNSCASTNMLLGQQIRWEKKSHPNWAGKW